MTTPASVGSGSLPESRTAVTLMARLGYGARGLIYLIVGGFTLAAVVDTGSRPHGLADAIAAIDSGWLRFAAAIVLCGGLACFAGYFTALSFRDWLARRGPRHWLAAAGMLGDAAIYAAFVAAIGGAALSGHGASEQQTHGWVAWALALPFGRGLVGVVGVIVLGCGIGLFAHGVTADLDRDLSLAGYEKRVLRPVARYGIGGRGAAIGLVGVYWLLAAIDADPSQAHALGGALQTLQQPGYGRLVLLLVGLAFVASAVFDLLEAVFHKPEPGGSLSGSAATG